MRKVLLNELQFSVAIAFSREEVVPRFRVVCPEGDWTPFVPLPGDIGERPRRMQLVYGFMAWKSATAFVMSSELVKPDCVISAAVDRKIVLIACRPIVRKPLPRLHPAAHRWSIVPDHKPSRLDGHYERRNLSSSSRRVAALLGRREESAFSQSRRRGA